MGNMGRGGDGKFFFYNPVKFLEDLTFPEQTRLNHAIEYQTRAHEGYASRTGVRGGWGLYSQPHKKVSGGQGSWAGAT